MKPNIKPFSKHFLIFFAFLLFFGFFQTKSTYAQSSQGTEFWICFPANIDIGSNSKRQLYITAQSASVVTIQIPGIAYNNVVNIPAGALSTIDLPLTVEVTVNGTVDNRGIHITSDNAVTVYAMSSRDASTDAYLALPVDAVGTDYYVLGYAEAFSGSNLTAQLTVVGTQDNTTVTITPTVTSGGFTAGVPGNVVLNAGQVFQLRLGSIGADYTGSRVVSDKPVSVFGGNSCTQVPNGTAACDMLVEQMTPTTSWGQSFVTVPLATRLAGDIFRVLARDNGTNVSINGGVVATLAPGQYYETSLASASYNRITADKPVLVGQYCKSSNADGIVSDPFFALVPPDEQFLNNYTVSAGTSNIVTNFLNITSPTSTTGSVLVDGGPVAPGAWTPIPSTSFSGAKVAVNNGIHTVTSTLPIGLLVYGYGSYDSYGYLGGQAFAAVATIESLTLTPVLGSAGINTNHCWEALVLNSLNEPVTGARVDFTITGVNPGVGFAFTDANGIATYCYTGVNPGNDVIVANVADLSDTASFNWTDQTVPIPVSNWALFIGLFLIVATVILRFRKF